MSDLIHAPVDGVRLLVDLQRVNTITKRFSGCLEPDQIALEVTHGLVEQFGLTLARIWLLEPQATHLKLVASSGLYTRTDGTFARVPMGAYKVGKIAQNQIPFLSNQLAEETWVKDRDWALTHGIQGFAGYPLASAEQVIGVLAVFSQHPLASEFLEVLQSLCTTTTIALESAQHHQQQKQAWQAAQAPRVRNTPSAVLSEQLAHILKTTQFTLVGTERSLRPALTYLFLEAAALLSQLNCIYGRLTYETTQMTLDAMMDSDISPQALESAFAEVHFASLCLGGTLQIQAGSNPGILQIGLKVPYADVISGQRIRIQCQSLPFQLAFTRLAYLAGFQVSAIANPTIPLLTDDLALAESSPTLIWLVTPANLPVPKHAKAKIDGMVNPQQFQDVVQAVAQGETLGIPTLASQELDLLSEREREILALLTQGLRDRDIASRLIISESTVKFHVHNVLTKLNARTRFQALYQALAQGCLSLE